MASELDDFVDKARKKGLDDAGIRQKLLDAGWTGADVDQAIDGLQVPTPPGQDLSAPRPDSHRDQPIAVVQNLSLRGFEYSIMFITLWISAFSVGGLAHSFINTLFSQVSSDYNYGDVNTFSSLMVTLLLVAFPIFAFMFLRLKKAEMSDPDLRRDPSRRRWVQLTQLVTFLTGLGYLAFFVYSLITPSRYDSNPGILEQFLHAIVTITIAGGIFAYYWRDEHRKV